MVILFWALVVFNYWKNGVSFPANLGIPVSVVYKETEKSFWGIFGSWEFDFL